MSRVENKPASAPHLDSRADTVRFPLFVVAVLLIFVFLTMLFALVPIRLAEQEQAYATAALSLVATLLMLYSALQRARERWTGWVMVAVWSVAFIFLPIAFYNGNLYDADGDKVTEFVDLWKFSLSRFVPFSSVDLTPRGFAAVTAAYAEAFVGVITLGVIINLVSQRIISNVKK